MPTDTNSTFVAGDPPVLTGPVRWSFDFEMVFLFELAEARRHLRPPLMPVELRPGVGMLAVSAQCLSAGNLGRFGAMREIYWAIFVQPSLALPMPTPRFALVTGMMATTDEGFLNYAHDVDRLPVLRNSSTLEIDVEREALRATARDADGPILELHDGHVASGKPHFEAGDFWGQQYLGLADDEPLFQAWRWQGHKFEHQQGGSTVRLHPHPFFGDLDLSAVAATPYMQLLTPPTTDGTLTLFDKIPLSNLRRRRRPRR